MLCQELHKTLKDYFLVLLIIRAEFYHFLIIEFINMYLVHISNWVICRKEIAQFLVQPLEINHFNCCTIDLDY